MTPLQRRAAVKATLTLEQMTGQELADMLGVSYNHLHLVICGQRQGSRELCRLIAEFIGKPASEVFDYIAD